MPRVRQAPGVIAVYMSGQEWIVEAFGCDPCALTDGGKLRELLARLIAERGVRPTLLSPIWSAAGFALGAATALLGPKAAMAATVAVEEVIEEHYREQRKALADQGTEPALTELVTRFGADETAHKDEALAQGAQEAPGYAMLTGAIKAGSRLAIWLSTRI